MPIRFTFFLIVAFAALAPFFVKRPTTEAKSHTFPGFPPPFSSMVELPLSPIEARFAEKFPGKIAKFEEAGAQYVVRFVETPTRMLHPATDCFRASGFDITPLARCEAPQAAAQGCFLATSKNTTLLVSESIRDAHGKSFNDVSAWYWATQTGTTQGPWWSVTTISRSISQTKHQSNRQ